MFTPGKTARLPLTYDAMSFEMFKLARVTARKFVDVDCCIALVPSIAFWMVKGQ